ncbi:MAG: alpha amylase C-terminal domain-containing protein [Candidatus Eisenbacteria bacterium]
MPASLEHISSSTPMGANLVEAPGSGVVLGATFRVWAPNAVEVHALGDWNDWSRSGDSLLHRDADGYWAGFFDGAREFHEYKFYVVGHGSEGFKRDPYARELTSDWPKSNCCIRSPRFPWADQEYRTPYFHDFVVYQLHVGTFYTPAWPHRAGTFLDVIEKIEYLDDLGITCLQLLPIVEFQSMFSMGYNGTDYFSPEMDFGVPREDLAPHLATVNRLLRAKGKPEVSPKTLWGPLNQLKMLVNLCHLYGMAVILDVVYNHAGGGFDDESIYFFDRDRDDDPNRSLYFLDRGHAGGLVFAMWKREVRQFLIDNAVFYLREYHVDGFRYDQVSVLVQENQSSGWTFCQDLTGTTRAEKPEGIDHAEYWPVDPWVVKRREEGGAGFETILHDGLRDSIRAVVREVSWPGGHPVDMDSIARSLRAPSLDAAWRAVQCIENHDEVYYGRDWRIPRLADPSNPHSWYARSRSRVALGLILLAPGIPMMFMGQEFLEDKQWADDIGHHNDMRIYWDGLGSADPSQRDFLRFAREAIALRFREPALRSEGFRVIHVHNRNRVLAFHRWVPWEGRDVVVLASFSDGTQYGYEIGMPSGGRWNESFNSDVYDHWVNPWGTGNGGAIYADGPGRHDMPASARVTIPANSILVFTRA